MSQDNLIVDSANCDITDLANVRGVRYSEGEKMRRIDKVSDRELLRLKEECWTQGSTDTLKLVEKEQRKRLKRQIPEWQMWSTWIGVGGVLIGLASLVVSLIE